MRCKQRARNVRNPQKVSPDILFRLPRIVLFPTVVPPRRDQDIRRGRVISTAKADHPKKPAARDRSETRGGQFHRGTCPSDLTHEGARPIGRSGTSSPGAAGVAPSKSSARCWFRLLLLLDRSFPRFSPAYGNGRVPLEQGMAPAGAAILFRPPLGSWPALPSREEKGALEHVANSTPPRQGEVNRIWMLT
jgi:hypothetical protein